MPQRTHSDRVITRVDGPTGPVVSVTMPTRDRPELLQRALASVVAATSGVADRFEVTVSDGSRDGASERVVRSALAGWGGSYRYVHNRPALSLPGNINRATELASGRWILQLHDDDYLRPGAGAVLVDAARSAESRGERTLLFGVDIVDEHGTRHKTQVARRERVLGPVEATRRVLTNSSFVRAPAILVHRTAFAEQGLFDTSAAGPCDTDMWMRLFARYGVRCLPQTTCAYTVHQGAATASMWNPATISIMDEIFARAGSLGVAPPATIRHWKSDFLHQFILAGAYRRLRVRQRSQAREVMQLFALPSVRAVGTSLKWLPVRVAFSVATAAAPRHGRDTQGAS